MAKEFAKAFYHSKEWLSCRASFITKRITIDGGMCQYCHERVGYIVDHVEELTPENINDPEIALNHNNFKYACTICHNIKTLSKSMVADFDDDGQPIPPID